MCMPDRIIDPTPSEQKILKEYFCKDDGKLRLLTCSSKYYYLTKRESFLVKCGLLSIKEIDRRLTNIAKFNRIKATLINKVKKKKTISPFLWKHPVTGKPILFTSMGVVYKLSYLDRLMLKLSRTNVTSLNKKAISKAFTQKIPYYLYPNPYYNECDGYEHYLRPNYKNIIS